MSFGERLREARLLKGYTQKQLAEKLDIGGTTVTGYEKDNSEPNMATISKIIRVLGVDANFLLQDEIPKLAYKNNATLEEFENLVKKYRELDLHGKKIVDFTLQEEWERSTAAASAQVLSFPDQKPEHLMSNAAHVRMDIEIPDDVETSENSIMDDENF